MPIDASGGPFGDMDKGFLLDHISLSKWASTFVLHQCCIRRLSNEGMLQCLPNVPDQQSITYLPYSNLYHEHRSIHNV